MRTWLRAASRLALLGVSGLVGCSDPTWGTAPTGSGGTVVYARQDEVQGFPGDTVRLDVVVEGPSGTRAGTWVSRNRAVAQVLGPGQLVLRGRGVTHVVVSAGVAQDSVRVAVDSVLHFDLGPVTSCEAEPRTATTRLADVGRVRLLQDVGNPRTDLTREDYRQLAQLLDTLVLPVAEQHFGPLLDLDGNGRLLVVLTKRVNAGYRPDAQTFPGGYVATRDLFPRRRVERLLGCPGSNHGEIFYLFTPDPDGVWSPPRPGVTLQRFLPALAIHELQHLINGEQRLHRAFAPQLERLWLNEGFSHLAEDLLYRHVTAQRPGEFRDLATLRRLGPVDTLQHPFWQYLRQNLIRATLVQEAPTGPGPFGADGQATRGATWMWLRWLDDQGLRRQPWAAAAGSATPGLGTVTHLLGGSAPAFDALLHRWHLGLALDALQWPVPAGSDLRPRSWSYASLSDSLFSTRPIQRWRWQPGQAWQGRVAPGAFQWVVLTGTDTLRFQAPAPPPTGGSAPGAGCLAGPTTVGTSVTQVVSADSLSRLSVCLRGPTLVVLTPTTLADDVTQPLDLWWGRPLPGSRVVAPGLSAGAAPDPELVRRQAEIELLTPRILAAPVVPGAAGGAGGWRITLWRGPA